MNNKGWKRESRRHSLASRGIKTSYKRLTGQTLSRYETDVLRFEFIDEWGYFDQEHFERWLDDKTNKAPHKAFINQRSLIFAHGEPKIDMRKRYLVGSIDEWDYITTMNPLEYIEYLKLEDDARLNKISWEKFSELTKGIGRIVNRNERTIDHDDAEGFDAPIFSLYNLYMDIGWLDQAIESREELQKRGYKNFDMQIRQEEELRKKLMADGTRQSYYRTKQQAEFEYVDRNHPDRISTVEGFPLSDRHKDPSIEIKRKKKEKEERKQMFDEQMKDDIRRNPIEREAKPIKTKKKLELEDFA